MRNHDLAGNNKMAQWQCQWARGRVQNVLLLAIVVILTLNLIFPVRYTLQLVRLEPPRTTQTADIVRVSKETFLKSERTLNYVYDDEQAREDAVLHPRLGQESEGKEEALNQHSDDYQVG